VTRTRLLTLVLLALVCPAPAAAQTAPPAQTQPPTTPAIRVGTTIFYDYTYQFEPKSTDADGNTISPNAFNVTRGYVNLTGVISPLISFRLTPDITRETGTGSSLTGTVIFRLKYAYAQFHLDDWLPDGTHARLGMLPTLYIESQESVYRYRFQGTLFSERDTGMNSADIGAAFRTTLPGGFGDAGVAVFNGEGYTRAEANDQKALEVRGTVRPFAKSDGAARGLLVTAFHLADHYVRSADRQRTFFAVTFEHKHFNAGFESMTGADQPSVSQPRVESSGYSFFFTPFVQEKSSGPEALVRFDSFKPDRDLEGRRNRIIVGAAYWFPHPGNNANAALLLDYEHVTFDNAPVPSSTQKRLALHGLIQF
jgi:hypothetical protein